MNSQQHIAMNQIQLQLEKIDQIKARGDCLKPHKDFLKLHTVSVSL